jgi:hypothetical protein
MTHIQYCLCGGICSSSTDTFEKYFFNHLLRAELPALECQSCHEKHFALNSLEQFELCVARKFLREEDFSKDIFRLVRKSLGLLIEEITVHFQPHQLIGVIEGDKMYISIIEEKLLNLVNSKITSEIEIELVHTIAEET